MKQSAITTNTDTPYIRTENQGKHTPVKSVNQTPKNEAVVSTSDTKETVGDKGKNTSFNTDITKGSDVVTTRVSPKENEVKSADKVAVKATTKQDDSIENKGAEKTNTATGVAENTTKNPIEKNTATTGIAENTKDEKNEVLEKIDPKKKSIFEEIEKEDEQDAIAENSGDKWSVGPSVAPVYFDAFGGGSPIHSNFVPNSKSGNVNLSYGVAVSYAINKKLQFRTGVHKVDYGYDTNEIAFSSSLNSSTNSLIDNISYVRTSRNLVVRSTAVKTETAEAFQDISANDPGLDGRMVQEFGYVEVPLELNYALVDKKVGVNVIGGFSSLFLVNNKVSLVSDELTTTVGLANNLNEVNFSTNIGFGINYKFTPKIQANVEPVFKYQLNTFSDTAGSFNPFSIGVYSGVSFKF